MSKFLKQTNKGFTLVETLVSISIFSMAILGLLSVLASSITNTTYAKQKMAADYLAQEGIEYMRNVRDTLVLYDPVNAQHGWDTFKVASMVYPITNPDFIGFTRTITLTPVSSDEVRISSNVSWKQGSENYNITFSENLFNWIQ
jgi:prepilin-type N-terminal cleavage/methylation domain-containing protein